MFTGVWESIRSPVTKDILFHVAEHERYNPPKPAQNKDLMPPPAKIPKRWKTSHARLAMKSSSSSAVAREWIHLLLQRIFFIIFLSVPRTNFIPVVCLYLYNHFFVDFLFNDVVYIAICAEEVRGLFVWLYRYVSWCTAHKGKFKYTFIIYIGLCDKIKKTDFVHYFFSLNNKHLVITHDTQMCYLWLAHWKWQILYMCFYHAVKFI